jgi:DNA-binding transcriptional ArsR family regulator
LNPQDLDEVLSSNVKLSIEDALSIRPRTLGELASITGISVQGVLRHLRRLEELRLVEERKLRTKNLRARAVYAARSHVVGNYSTPDVIIVKSTERQAQGPPRERDSDLEARAAEVLVLRRRVREQARKLGRLIDELVDEQEAVKEGVENLPLTDEDRLVLGVILTEETLGDGLKVLSRYYGIEDRRPIDKALAKARRSGRE